MMIIRKAEQKDIPSIYNLVVELAVFENEPEAVTTQINDYENNFGEGLFEAIVAEQNGRILAMALYYMTFSTWKGRMLYIEDFVVTKSARKKGIGQLIFDAVILEAKKKKAKLLKWQVLDWNKPAISFYKKNNAIIEKDWYNGKLMLE
ncbi:MAG TPA: GNAT family N-acetyltransferase [Saprospiraceae bacterium]|nr:GNAT family N-acetyltransferase [Saprospiraceae bacterium]